MVRTHLWPHRLARVVLGLSCAAYCSSGFAQFRRGFQGRVRQSTPAVPCVTVVRQNAVAGVSESVLMLTDEISVDRGCRVSLSLDEPGREIPLGRWSYLQLVAAIQRPNENSRSVIQLSQLPREIFFRRTSHSHPESVLLSRCVDSLATDAVQTQIHDRDQYCDGTLSIAADARSCPAQLSLQDTVLLSSQQSLSLCRDDRPLGSLEIFASSGRPDDRAQLSIGHVETNTAGTPLQRALRELQNSTEIPVWFSLATSHGMLVLEPTSSLSAASNVLNELRVASASQQLIVATGDRVIGHGVFTNEGQFLRLQDRVWADDLQREYGPVARVFAPLAQDAIRAVQGVKLCIPTQYSAPTLARAPLGRRLDRRDLCVPIRLAHDTPTRLRQSLGITQVLVTQHHRQMTTTGAVVSGATRTSREVLLEQMNQARQTSVLSVGDTIAVTGPRDELYICSENGACAPVGPQGHTMTQSGVTELRRAPTQQDAESAQAMAVARWIVLNPWRDWVMDGLVTSRESVPGPLWEQLRHDDGETFSYERRVSALDSHVAWSAGAVALRQHWSAQLQTVLTTDVPALTGVAPSLGARSQSALAVVFSRSEQCPATEHERVDPNALLPATVFYGHLQRQDDSRWCIASVKFRVRYRRVFATSGLTSFGYLGDPRIAWFSPWVQWGAVGMIVPAVFARVSLGPWSAAELSLSAIAGASVSPSLMSPSSLSVTGPALTGDIRFGVITFGGSLFVPQLLGVTPVQVRFEPFVSLDLGSLYELVGGR